jgi:hypothetical protein
LLIAILAFSILSALGAFYTALSPATETPPTTVTATTTVTLPGEGGSVVPARLELTLPELVGESGAGTISVSAQGSVTFIPDRAKIVMSIVTESEEVLKAVSKNAEAFSSLVDSLSALDLSKDELRTLSYQISPIYRWSDGTAILVGYRVTHQLEVTVLGDPETLGVRAGEVIDAATRAGVNRLDYILFTIDDDALAGLKEEALRIAVGKVVKKAELMAEALGLKIAAVKSLNEAAVSTPTRVIAEQYLRAEMVPAPPTELVPGELTVTVSVSGVFLLGEE